MSIQGLTLNSNNVIPKVSWFPGIQELRGLLIVLIILSHAQDFPFVNSKSVWGAAGVTGFFMIAGFLCPEKIKTTDSSIRCGFANVISTIKKIYIPYIVCLLVSVFVRPGSLTDFFKCLFLSQSYWGSTTTATSFNGNMWFLSSILLSYFFAPLLAKRIIGQKIRYSAILFFGLLLFQLLYGMLWSKCSFESGYYWFYIFPVYRIGDFTEGIIIRNIYNQCHKEMNIYKEPIFIISVILFGVELVIIESITKQLQYDVAWVPLMAIMLVCCALKESLLLYPLRKIGGVSMELFLSHRLVMLIVLRFGNGIFHFFAFVIIASSVAIILKMSRRKLGGKSASREYILKQ